jgi:hypothetical protein
MRALGYRMVDDMLDYMRVVTLEQCPLEPATPSVCPNLAGG